MAETTAGEQTRGGGKKLQAGLKRPPSEVINEEAAAQAG